MGRVIAVANQKGGVGKTTTAVNLAATSRRPSGRTLLVDFDPQGNASSGFGYQRDERRIYDALIGEGHEVDDARPRRCALHLCRRPRPRRRRDRAGLRDRPRAAARARARRVARRLRLRDHRLPAVARAADPERAGRGRRGARAAAVRVLRARGAGAADRDDRAGAARAQPGLAIEGVLLTMFDARNNLTHQVATRCAGTSASRCSTTIIPRNVRLSEAPSHGKPILLYDVHSKGARATSSSPPSCSTRFHRRSRREGREPASPGSRRSAR